LRAAIGTLHCKMSRRARGARHLAGIELHLGNRYFAVTGEHLDGTPVELQLAPAAPPTMALEAP